MSNIAYTIPNLIQGVSQQPDAQRDPSQAEIQINGVSSIAEGLRKRDSSRSIAKVSNTSFGDCYIHTILRDANEKYLAVIRPTGIDVFDLEGNAKTVNLAANALDYFVDSGLSASENVDDARNQIRAVTIADYTFVLNTRRTATMTADLAPETPRPSAHECLVWVKQAAYGNLYRVNCNGVEVTVETPVAPVVSTGGAVQENRISSEDIADGLRRQFVGGAVATETFETGLTGSLNGTRTDVDTVVDGAVGAQGMQVSITGDGTNITAITKTASGSGYEAGDEVSVFKKDLESDGYTGDDALDLVKIATVNTVGAGPLTGVTIQRSGAVLWFQSASAITIQATDAKSNSTLTAILGEVQIFTELPTVAPEGYQIEITGDPGNNFDNYHVEFEPRSGTFAEGSWVETVAPGSQYKIEKKNMPHLLVRLSSGDFWFGPADGSTQGGTEIEEWGKRTSGDDITSVLPTFIDHKINDVFIYKNRLGFLADESVILSRTRKFFEFFPETVTTVLDTDPIDVIASNNRVSILQYAVPYQDELIVFSEQYQFRFNAAETVLTPATAQITILTQFDTDINVRPMQAGGGILFVQENEQWSQVREFSVRGAGTALTADAADVTAYVSSYIPDQLFKMTVNDTGNCAFFLSGKSQAGPFTEEYRNRVYVYKWFFRNSGQGTERAQSSWSYWQFNGQVLQVEAIEEQLYALVLHGSEVWLESIAVMDRMSEEVAAPYPMLLDRLVSTTTATPAAIRMADGVYDISTNLTTWTLTYTATAKTQLWSGYKMGTGTAKPGPRLLSEISSGTTFTCKGDYSTTPVWAGEPYEFRYRFTRFKYYAEIGGGKAAVNTVRTQIRRAKLRFHESGFFQVKVLPEYRAEGLYTWDGVTLAVRSSYVGQPPQMAEDIERYYTGVFSIPVIGDGNRILVEILNDTPHPCKFSTCEWVGNLTDVSRSRR